MPAKKVSVVPPKKVSVVPAKKVSVIPAKKVSVVPAKKVSVVPPKKVSVTVTTKQRESTRSTMEKGVGFRKASSGTCVGVCGVGGVGVCIV